MIPANEKSRSTGAEDGNFCYSGGIVFLNTFLSI